MILVETPMQDEAFQNWSLWKLKNYLRSDMSHLRLTSLAVLSIERELTEKLRFGDVIRDFATRKARKVNLN